MSIQDRRFSRDNPYARKANQEWELAGCARHDGDLIAAKQHTERATKLEQLAREWDGE